MSEDQRDQPPRDEAADEQERARAFREQLRQVHATDLAYEMTLSLVSFGSQKLGLTDATAEVRDLDDARVAIELLRALIGVLDEQTGAAPTRELHDTLAQLQLGYVQALQLQQEAATAGAADEAPGPAAQQPPAEGAEPDGGADEPDDEAGDSEGGASGPEPDDEPDGGEAEPDDEAGE